MTAAQVTAIIMLLQAFGVSQPVIDTVRTEITPTAQISPETTSTDPTGQTATSTTSSPVSPVLGATEATSTPCVDSPIFDFRYRVSPQVITRPLSSDTPQVPYGQQFYMVGNVKSACTGQSLTYPSQYSVDGVLNYGAFYAAGAWQFGRANNGTRLATTTVNFTVNAMGQSFVVPFTLLPE